MQSEAEVSERLDPAVAAILAALLEAYDDKSGLSVPRLRKQLGLPLSLVMRTLSALIDAELVELTRSQDQNIALALTDAGLGFARRHQGPRIEALRQIVR